MYKKITGYIDVPVECDAIFFDDDSMASFRAAMSEYGDFGLFSFNIGGIKAFGKHYSGAYLVSAVDVDIKKESFLRQAENAGGFIVSDEGDV